MVNFSLPPTPTPADYVVLENLTSKFSAPSVLDLKVGTRQHSDTASEEKIRKHSETCTNSTSGSLGVRMCGMQVREYEYVSGLLCIHTCIDLSW